MGDMKLHVKVNLNLYLGAKLPPQDTLKLIRVYFSGLTVKPCSTSAYLKHATLLLHFVFLNSEKTDEHFNMKVY